MTEAPLTTAENSTLLEIGRIITASPDIDEVYAQFAELVKLLIPFDRIHIVSIDEEREEVRVEFVHGVALNGAPAQRGYARPLAGSITEQVIAQPAGVLFAPPGDIDVAKEFPSYHTAYRLGVRSSVVVPLVTSGKVTGALYLVSYSSSAYDREHLRLAEKIGLQISGAVANARLRAEHDQVRRELSTLAAIGRVVNSSLDNEHVLGQIVDQTRRLLIFDALAVNLLELGGATLRTAHMAGENLESRWRVGRIYSVEGTVSEDVLRDGRGVAFDPKERAEMEERYSGSLPAFDAGYRSLLVVPLAVGDDAIGTMTLLNKANGAYSTRDVGVAERVASEVSGAVANARLYEERGRAKESARESETWYRTLIENMDAAVTLKDAEGRYILVNQRFADHAGHPEGIIGKTVHELGLEPEVANHSARMDAQVVRIGEGVRFEDSVSSNGDLQSFLTWKAPIKDDNGHVSAVVSVSTENTEQHRSQERIKRLALDAGLLAEIGRTVSSAPVIDDVFETISKLIAELLPIDSIGINVVESVDGRSSVVIHHSEGGVIPWNQGDEYDAEGTFAQAVARELRPMHFSTTSREAVCRQYPGALKGYDAGIRSFMGAPLLSKGKPFGAITVGSSHVDAYDDSQMELLARVAAQISGPIANAQLYSDRVQAEGELSTLFEAVAHPVVVADRSEVIRRANSRAYAEFGYAEDELIGNPIEMLIPSRHVERHQQHRNTWFYNPLRRPMGDDQVLHGRRKDGSEFPVDVWLSPVEIGGETWSMAGIRDITEELRAREALEESEAAYKRMSEENAAMAEIGRVIGSSPGIEEVYELFGERVRQLIPFDKIDIVSVDLEREELRVEFVYGLPEDAATGHTGYIRPLADSIAEEVLRRGKGVLSVPRDRDEVVRGFPASVGSFDRGRMSIIAVPLFAQGRGIGIIVVSSAAPRAYTPEDLRLLERVGAQISGPVANSQLFTKHLKAEKALRGSEQRFRDLYEGAPIPYISTDRDGLIVSANPQACDMFGYPLADLIGRLTFDLYADTPSGIGRGRELSQQLEVGQQIRSAEVELQRSDGTTLWGSLSVDPVTGPDGGVVAFHTTIQDSPKRMAAENALRLSQANYEALMENMEASTSLKGLDGRYVLVNQNFADRVGIPREQIVGRTASEIYATQAGFERAESLDQEVIESGKSQFSENGSLQGGCKVFEIRRAPVLDHEGKVSGIVAVSTEVTQMRAAEAELRSVHDQYRLMVDSLEEAVSMKEVSGRFVLVNKAFADRLGLPKDEIEGRYSEEFHENSAHADIGRRQEEEVLRTGEGIKDEFTSDGESGPRIHQISHTPVPDSEGRIQRIVSVSWDITERKRAERALRESEENYRTLIESMDANVNLKAADGRYVVVNRRFAERVGLPSDQLVGRTAHDIYSSKEAVDEVESQDREVVESAKPIKYANQGTPADPRAFETRKTPVLDDDGNVTGIVTIATDVTQIRAAETELRSVHEHYRVLVDNLEEAVSMKEASGRFVLVNKAFADRLGLPKEEIEGRFQEDIDPDTALAKVASQKHEENLRAGKGVEEEVSIDQGFGPRTFYIRHIPVPDSQGRIQRIVSSSWDITVQKGLENQLLQSQKMEAIGRLAGGVAHDFNNLLTAVMGYAEMGRRDPSNESMTGRAFREILQVAERAATLTRQLLTFSRTRSGNPIIVDLNDLVLGMDSMLRRLIAKDIELITLTSQTPLIIRADRGQMEQVLTNLVVNARDAMPNGGKLTVETADAGLGHALLTVSDTGVGMTDDVRQHIFEPFYTTKGVGEGSGLGLSTSYGIVVQGGGHIDVSTELGQGTEFKVVFPIADGDANASSSSNLGTLTGGDETILLVEDEPNILETTSASLRDLGYSVIGAANGVDAISVVEAHVDDSIDLLLTDMVMPMMGGRETARRVRQTLPGIRILFTSGFHGDSLEDLGSMEPQGQFIAKPFNLEALASKVREVLDQ